VSREEQLRNIADMLGVPVEHEGIQVLAIGRNKWIILYFNNAGDAHRCKQQLSGNIQEQNIIIITNNNTENIAPSEVSSSPSTDSETLEQMILLDIPSNTPTKKVRSILTKYGEIESLRLTKGNHNYNSAIFSFKSTKTNIHKIWSIPIEDSMARMAQLKNYQATLLKRNEITARLYGIGKSTSASRIMSATKHLRVKTVYIPTNGRTGKRRNFAILGFENQEDLNKALLSHVELFGCKTWWSTKDNTKMHTLEHISQDSQASYRKKENKKVSSEHSRHNEGSPASTSTYMDMEEEEEEYQIIHTQKTKGKKGKQSLDRKTRRETSIEGDPWSEVFNMLNTISARLTNLENKRSTNRNSFHYSS
jgi:RNA recognition motif-containing protein